MSCINIIHDLYMLITVHVHVYIHVYIIIHDVYILLFMYMCELCYYRSGVGLRGGGGGGGNIS